VKGDRGLRNAFGPTRSLDLRQCCRWRLSCSYFVFGYEDTYPSAVCCLPIIEQNWEPEVIERWNEAVCRPEIWIMRFVGTPLWESSLLFTFSVIRACRSQFVRAEPWKTFAFWIMHSIFISDLWLGTALVRLAVRVFQMKVKLYPVSNLGRLAAHVSQTNISLLLSRQSHPFARHQ